MRYYSSTTGAMALTVAAGSGDTSITVDTVVGLPVSYPYTVVIEPGVSGQEEIVTVTAAAGSTLTVTRGEDSTTAVNHSLGSAVRHMMTARDLRESREHEAAVASVHGVTGDLVGADQVQTLDNKTFEADGDHTPLTVRAAVGQTTPLFALKSDVGTTTWYGTAAQWQSDAIALQTSGSANLFGMVAHVKPPSGKDGVVVNHATGSAGYAWKGQKAGVNKSLIDIDGNAQFAGLTATTGAFSGAITSPTITTINATAASQADDIAALETATDGIFVGTSGRKYRVIGGVIRNTGSGWAWIDDSGHRPSGVGALNVTATGIEIPYVFSATKVVSFAVTPDEAYARRGLRVGASVGLTSTTIELADASYDRISDRVRHNGTTWVSEDGVYSGFSFSGGILTLTHEPMGVGVGSTVALAGRGSAQDKSGTLTSTTTQVVFYTGAAGSLSPVTTPGTNCDVTVTRFGKRSAANVPILNPATVSEALGNLWVVGVFEVA